MKKLRKDVAILGGGIAAVAAATELHSRGVDLVLISADHPAAATHSNQKWQQSGALYAEQDQAATCWRAFSTRAEIEQEFVIRRGACFLSCDPNGISQRSQIWEAVGIPHSIVDPLCVGETTALGLPAAAAAATLPDCTCDFAALCTHLREKLPRGAVIDAARGALVRDGAKVEGVCFQGNGRESFVSANHVVVAAGAWTNSILRGIDVDLPITSYKTHVLAVEEELVPSIVAWIDGPLLSVVPWAGRTLFADHHRQPWDDPESARELVPEAIERLWHELRTAFPLMRRDQLDVLDQWACLKTEHNNGRDAKNRTSAIFDVGEHGLTGLTVIIPGKASLACQLGRSVAALLMGHGVEPQPSLSGAVSAPP